MKKWMTVFIVGLLVVMPIAYAFFGHPTAAAAPNRVIIKAISDDGISYYTTQTIQEKENNGWYSVKMPPLIIEFTKQKYSYHTFHLRVIIASNEQISSLLFQNKEVDIYIPVLHTIIVLEYDKTTRTLKYPGGSMKISPNATILSMNVTSIIPSDTVTTAFSRVHNKHTTSMTYILPKETIKTIPCSRPHVNDIIVVSPFEVRITTVGPVTRENDTRQATVGMMFGVLRSHRTAPQQFKNNTVKILLFGTNKVTSSTPYAVFTSHNIVFHNCPEDRSFSVTYTNYYALGGTASMLFVLLP